MANRTTADVCKVCSEPIESETGLLGWLHRGTQDAYCWTGDGAVAIPASSEWLDRMAQHYPGLDLSAYR